ncbi:unnamed protein product [Microthlaspi erraticum]|uniref:Uncharacterized protein n=1 Tax=Microthlaspi erraticum TaxID=1685480 RepID=A0A6D2J676_9BRAS|nr:unnamed protein product [Microthlaspi erraticum]
MRVKHGNVICVIRWGLIELRAGKVTIYCIDPSTFVLNPLIPELDEFQRISNEQRERYNTAEELCLTSCWPMTRIDV